jgi:hypothetical protein
MIGKYHPLLSSTLFILLLVRASGSADDDLQRVRDLFSRYLSGLPTGTKLNATLVVKERPVSREEANRIIRQGKMKGNQW